ncbi:sulfatase-like hydrolase/transferase [Allopusillimonas ginsengisoli]|uniref:sulfatase-like hydrolase/transferase n=1 Tax=Allopusillimonas ginsengisoli TaxID=453575 RepID=UPI001432106E|nr:sulfatase-like hydrolase/transferase [Allopusillimonas ginsengisoli]
MKKAFFAASLPHHSQLVATVLIVLAYLAERPYVFFKYPGYLEQSGWPKISALILFIFIWWLLCFFLYLYAAKSRPIAKWSIFVLLAVSSTAFDLYYAVSGGAPLLYEDYAILVDAIRSSGDALAEYYPLLTYSAIRLLLLFCAFWMMAPTKGASLKAMALLVSSILVFSSVCVLKHGTYTNLLPGTTGIYGLSLASLFDGSSKAYVYQGESHPSNPTDDINILVVMDESVRADFLSARDLQDLFAGYTGDWRYYDFGAATSAGNCSASSNIMIRKGVRPLHVTDDLYSKPLVWSYARNAGFTTYLLDAQRGGKGHDHFDARELSLVDHNIDASKTSRDADIPALMAYLNEQGKTFSIAIMNGSHFPYHNNFPADYTIQLHSEYVAADTTRVEYAKSVNWQTKGFIKALTALDLSKPTIAIYTSDHGQNINDQPGPHHCTGSGHPFIGEGLVPLVVFTNYQDEMMEAATSFNYQRLSHFNIFPTVLQYMGFDVASIVGKRSTYLSPITSKAVPFNRFTYGDAFGRFGQAVKTMDVTAEKQLVLKRSQDMRNEYSHADSTPQAFSTVAKASDQTTVP